MTTLTLEVELFHIDRPELNMHSLCLSVRPSVCLSIQRSKDVKMLQIARPSNATR